MGSDGAGRLRGALRALEPPPRLVDWSLLAIVCLQTASGLASFTVGTPAWWPLFWFHRIAGLALLPLLGYKLARVRYRLADSDQWQPSTALSVLALVAVVGALATGVVWVFGLDVRIAYWTLLSVHVGFGLALVPIAIAHALTRYRRHRQTSFDQRRTTLQFAAAMLFGAVTYRAQALATRLLGWHGADRRFTGSQPRPGDGNAAFPITSWVADDPEPIDQSAWRLTVRGEVAERLALTIEELSPDSEREALLDCTSGWYTVQRWQGRSVGDLLDAAGVGDEAQYVRFVSVTGYRWSLPIEEAREALLATHVGGERLSHGHGAPLRLVAPGRRGFQWVKWIERIDVRRRADPAQWVVTLVSGFD